MDEWLPSVYEYLCNSRELLERDVSNTEAEVLREKVEYFSALLDEEMDCPREVTVSSIHNDYRGIFEVLR
jgi:hypothetical protein